MTLHDMLVDEIRDLYHAEKQLVKALPKLAKAANSESLRDALESHLEETQEQVSRLEEVFEALGEKVKAKTCAGMAGIIEEANDTMKEDADGAVMDAALIAAAQRAEHYEIGAYGTCAEWARLLGLNQVVSLLEQTLREEKAADKKLTEIAEQEINRAAIGEAAEEPAAAGASASAGRSAVRAMGGARTMNRRQSTTPSRVRARAADRHRR